MSRFDWDPAKNRENLRKHGVRFETAVLVFEDEWIVSRKDLSHSEAEERYNALGEIGPGAILFVVYTWREQDENEEEVIRLISARSASAQEKRSYEEARSRAQARHRRHRSKDRRYD